MNRSRIKPFLIGRDWKTLIRFSLLTVGVVLVVLGLVVARDMLGIALTAFVPRGISVYLIPAVFILAAANAYYNDGVLVCWLIIFAPLFFAFVNYIGSGIAIGTNPTQIEWILLSASGGLLYAVILGTIAFILGSGSRRAISRITQ